MRATTITILVQNGIVASTASLWREGLGRARAYAIVGNWVLGDRSLPVHAMFANMFQILISIFYMFYDNILTCQLAADEFVGYLSARNSLRVTSPKTSVHKSSHFLSLPWSYGIPQVLVFMVLHWLASQSVFLVTTIAYGAGPGARRLPEDDGSAVGWSAGGILLTTLWYAVLILMLVLNSLRRYRGVPAEFPSLATNSSGLVAITQRLADDDCASLYPVTIGIVPDAEKGCRGRLAFTTNLDNTRPVDGEKYQLPTW